MKEYANSSPVFTEEIDITEVSDYAHADVINTAPIQIFQNTLYNKQKIDELNTSLTKLNTSSSTQSDAIDTIKELVDALNSKAVLSDTIRQIVVVAELPSDANDHTDIFYAVKE